MPQLTLQPAPAKLRSDLIFSYQEMQGRPFYIIKDPVNGQFFRFREVECFIARQFDGENSLDAIREIAEQKFQASLDEESLVGFIDTLRGYGLLEKTDGESERATSEASPVTRDDTPVDDFDIPGGDRRTRVSGSLLYLRFKAFNPDRFFGWLVDKIRFCFTTDFVAFSAFVIAVGFVLTVANWDAIRNDFSRLYSIQGLVLAWLTIMLVGTVHECAHGLTCKHFGGEVHELGFMLLYFQPALYCNVSEAWLFPEKYKRLWVSIAGAYFELFVWAVATVIWRVTETSTWINFLSLIVLATSGIKTLFNLNPLLRLDGYYLLSDYLEIPNLRRRSFSYLGTVIKKMRGPRQQEVDDATPRERRIFITYGLLAAGFSFWFLGFFLFRSGSALAQYQGIGLAFFTIIFLHKFRRKIGKFVPIAAVKIHPVRRTIALLKRPSRAMMALVVVLVLLFLGRLELMVPGDMKAMPIHNADVRSEVEGIIEEIPVNEGQQVQKGDLIARLSDWDYRSELRQAEAEIQQKQAKLQMLEAGSTYQEIDLARKEAETSNTKQQQAQNAYAEAQQLKSERLAKSRIAIKKAEERLKFAQNNLNRFKAFMEENIFSRRELEAAEEDAAVREKELEEAKAELRLLLADDLAQARTELAVSGKEAAQAKARLDIKLAGSRQEEIAAVKADLALSAAKKQFLEEQISRLRVVSPITGVVATPSQQLREMSGQLVKKGELIAKVYDLKTITAEIPVSEKDIADVRVGQNVAVKFRGYPQQTFHGEVRSVAASADDGSGGKVAASVQSSPTPKERIILVTTVIDNSSLLLKPEMTGKAKILCGKHTIFDLMRRGLARALKVEFWSWW